MAKLTNKDKNILEDYLQMGGGHLLNFTHKTLGGFFEDLDIDIDDEVYHVGSGSKANKMRGFWTVSDNATVGRVLIGLIQQYDEDRESDDHKNNPYSYTSEHNENTRNKCLNIANQLISGTYGTTQSPVQQAVQQQLWQQQAPQQAPVQVAKQKVPQQAPVQVAKQKVPQQAPVQVAKQKVFVVHGHDDALRLNVENFILKIGLEPIILMYQASAGDTIIEKLENHGEADYAIVLYTACDFGKGKSEEALKTRARQNVVFEHGYFISRLGRKKVAAIVAPGVETPNDTSGIVYIGVNDGWKISLARELKKAKLKFDSEAVYS